MFLNKMVKEAAKPFMRICMKISISAWRYDSSVTDPEKKAIQGNNDKAKHSKR